MIFYKALKDMIGFVKKLAKDSGGFGATPRLPATIEDTYHAFRIIDLARQKQGEKSVKIPGSIDAHRRYLKSNLHVRVNSPKTLFQLLWSRRFLGIPIDDQCLSGFLSDRSGRGMSVDYQYYMVKIMTELFHDSPMEVPEFHMNTLSPSWKGIVKERWMIFYVDSILGLKSIDCEMAARWFRDCQNMDGGFGFMPHTTSYIDNCDYALRALSMLKKYPRDVDAAIRFIMACKTGSGGFSRKNSAAPFLDATWHAAMSLAVLDSFSAQTHAA